MEIVPGNDPKQDWTEGPWAPRFVQNRETCGLVPPMDSDGVDSDGVDSDGVAGLKWTGGGVRSWNGHADVGLAE